MELTSLESHPSGRAVTGKDTHGPETTQPLKMSANGKLALVTHPPGLLERERLHRNQAEKPESSTSYVWNVTLKMLLGNKVVAIMP